MIEDLSKLPREFSEFLLTLSRVLHKMDVDRIASALREAYENKSARAVMEPGFTAAEIKEWVQTLAPAYEPGRSSAQTQAGESRSTAKPKASEARRPSRSKSKRKVPSTRVSRHPGRATSA